MIAIIIPTYNEDENILKLINKVLKEDPKGEALIYSQQCFEWLKIPLHVLNAT